MAAAAGLIDDEAQFVDAAAELLDDFPSFCSLLPIRTKEGGIVPFHYESWWGEQKTFEAERTGFDLVIKPRQIGFSTLELARDLWHAITHPGEQVLVVVHDHDIKEQLYVTIRMMAEGLRDLGLLPRTRYSTKTELVFADTGSAVRIVEAGETDRSAKKKGRSGTVHRLHATEVAFWGAAAETMGAILGSLTEGAEVVIESTANGAGGIFYEDVQASIAGKSDYKLHFFPWYEHREYRKAVSADFDSKPRDKWERRLREKGCDDGQIACDDGQIAWWRSKVDDPKFGLEKALQEYPIDTNTCFRSPGRAYFAATDLDAIADLVTEPIQRAPLKYKKQRFGDALIYEKPKTDCKYVVFGDVSEGTGEDAHSAHVLEARTGATVATFWSDSIEPGDFGLALAVLGWLYNTARVGWERNNHGHATQRALTREAKYRPLYRHDDKKLGWPTNSATRPVLWDDLHHAICEGSVWTPDAATLAECRTLIKGKDGKPQASGKGDAGGCKDDRYVSWAGAWQLRSRPTYTPRSFHVKGA